MATIAILMPGDMGHGVGQALIERGHRAVSPLEGRSAHTRGLAERAGIEDLGTIDGCVAEADLILSILPVMKFVTNYGTSPDVAAGTATGPEGAWDMPSCTRLTLSSLARVVVRC